MVNKKHINNLKKDFLQWREYELQNISTKIIAEYYEKDLTNRDTRILVGRIIREYYQFNSRLLLY